MISQVTTSKTAPAHSGTLNVPVQDVKDTPFPHIIKEQFLEPALYGRLRKDFPSKEVFDMNSTVGGRAGRDLYRGDPAYDELLIRSSAWREFHDFINSPAYIAITLELFGAHLMKFECDVDPAKARFVDYVEEREVLADKSRIGRMAEGVMQKLQGAKNKDDLFVRLDLGQAAVGYGKPIHCDRPNRLTSMLVYLCDADEIALRGGELIIHEHKEKKPYRAYERHPKEEDTREVLRLRPKHNLGVFFVCSNNSYHSATAVTAQKGYRDFLYISISSRAPTIW